MLVSLSIAHSLVHSVSLIPSCRYTSTCSKKLGLQGVTHFNVSAHLLMVQMRVEESKSHVTSDVQSPRPPSDQISRYKPQEMTEKGKDT